MQIILESMVWEQRGPEEPALSNVQCCAAYKPVILCNSFAVVVGSNRSWKSTAQHDLRSFVWCRGITESDPQIAGLTVQDTD